VVFRCEAASGLLGDGKGMTHQQCATACSKPWHTVVTNADEKLVLSSFHQA
jgi:hypothetical protein